MRAAPGALAAWTVLLLCRPSAAQGDAPSPAPAPDREIADRLDRLEAHLARLEASVERLEGLFRDVFGERLRRAEAVAADPALAAAVTAVETRYAVRGTIDALISEETEKLSALHRSLSRAAARSPRAFAADPDVTTVLAAMAARADFLSGCVGTFVTALAGTDLEAARVMALALLERPADGAQEAALWAAIRARDPALRPRLAAFAAGVDPGRGQLAALAAAAAAASGDAASADRLVAVARSETLPRGFVYQLATELRNAGDRTAFLIFLELLADEQYAFAAAQAFGRIDGFDRRVGWREVKEGRDALRDEFKAWLDRSWAGLRYDAQRARFTVAPAEAPKK